MNTWRLFACLTAACSRFDVQACTLSCLLNYLISIVLLYSVPPVVCGRLVLELLSCDYKWQIKLRYACLPRYFDLASKQGLSHERDLSVFFVSHRNYPDVNMSCAEFASSRAHVIDWEELARS